MQDSLSGYRALFDDGGRVAYGYLLDERQQVVSDVWLYNCGSAPSTPGWNLPDARDRMPFQNAEDYIKTDNFEPVSESEIAFRFFRDKSGNQGVEVFLGEQLHARLVSGEKPGECVLAIRRNAIARPFD